MLSRDAIIQAALDPAVSKILNISSVVSGQTGGEPEDVAILRGGRFYVLDIDERERYVRTLDSEGVRLLAMDILDASRLRLTRGWIRENPRCFNARLIWQCCGVRVGAGLRAEIIALLECREEILLSAFSGVQREIFALVCEAVLAIDLNFQDITRAPVRLADAVGKDPQLLVRVRS